jgi:dCTP deaminase
VLASDADIDEALREGILTVTPWDPQMLQPASLDLRLDRSFWLYAPMPPTDVLFDPTPIIDPAREQPDMMYRVDVAEGRSFLLQPQQFALAATLERLTVSASIAAALEGKSSLGRLGLLVHATAGWIDPGFDGHITLELFNAAPFPIRLYPGMKIAQLAVMALRRRARRPYGSDELGSRYQNQRRGPQRSKGFSNFRTWPTPIEENPDV